MKKAIVIVIACALIVAAAVYVWDQTETAQCDKLLKGNSVIESEQPGGGVKYICGCPDGIAVEGACMPWHTFCDAIRANRKLSVGKADETLGAQLDTIKEKCHVKFVMDPEKL